MLRSILFSFCPRCRKGPMFGPFKLFSPLKSNKMHSSCSNCKLVYSLEPGFFFGAAYVSYGLNMAWIIPLFILEYVFLDFSYELIILSILVLGLILTPFIFRLSRSIYLHIFVKYDPDNSLLTPNPKSHS